uniref:Forkhead box protein N3 n=1 Tax=Paramormyrops kingsleyae TaxID=1676925 RepID=A0A3B3QLI4_9TELE
MGKRILALMGPVMPPSKKAESPGVSVARGLSPFCRASSLGEALQEAAVLGLPLPLSPVLKPEDEELTNLNWLHETADLLNSFGGDAVLRSVSPVQEPGRRPPPSPAPPEAPGDLRRDPNGKPPYSFSCLIFMAIEEAPAKRLPVKDIYNWILEHFPYFASAPTGWKNSVRHNLSLNKCFKKVDKDRSQNIGKGSLWCIDPEYRQNLIQALKKTPYHSYSQVFSTPPTSQAYQSMSSPCLWPGSPFFRKNGGVLLQVPQGVIQNGARMMSPGLFPGIRALPINPLGSRTATVRSVPGSFRARGDSGPPDDIGDGDADSPLANSDPKQDHNYSSAKSSQFRGDASPGSDPAEEGGRPGDGTGSDAEEDESRSRPGKGLADAAAEPSQHRKRAHWTKGKPRGDTLPLKKRRTEKPPESDDEEMKEAAGSLLHLAGMRACLNNITNRTAKGQKEHRDSLKN